MALSEKAQKFMDSLAPDATEVGDGSDGKPVWVGIDAEASKRYAIHANGVATGFGDGELQIFNGLHRPDVKGDIITGRQSTHGNYIFSMAENEDCRMRSGALTQLYPEKLFKADA